MFPNFSGVSLRCEGSFVFAAKEGYFTNIADYSIFIPSRLSKFVWSQRIVSALWVEIAA